MGSSGFPVGSVGLLLEPLIESPGVQTVNKKTRSMVHIGSRIILIGTLQSNVKLRSGESDMRLCKHRERSRKSDRFQRLSCTGVIFVGPVSEAYDLKPTLEGRFRELE